MKHILMKCMAIALLSITLACQDDPEPQPERDSQEIVEVTPVGEVTGTRTTKEIGPGGGVINSDGITINIPDGALPQNTMIGIEPITTTNPAGVGQSFRLLPHGTKFVKPVTITFSYAEAIKDIPLIDALTISYQDNLGTWRVAGDTQINTESKTISVTTDHFSDWVPMKWLDLKPAKAELELGKTLTLKAIRYIPMEDEDFLVVPLVPNKAKDLPVIKAVPLETKYILNWELGGPGSLKSNGNSAVLTAPESAENGSGAAVSVALKSPGITKRWLVSNITYLADQYLMVRFNGGEWKEYYGVLTYFQKPQYYSITGMVNPSDEIVPLVIIWKQGEGIHNWTEPHEKNFVEFQYAYNVFNSLGHLYENSKEDIVPSGGTLNVPKINKDGYTTGTFNLTSAGRWIDGEYVQKETVEGKFKLKYRAF